MVFDLSGSMNEILSGENQLKDIGEFSSVKNHLDINKVYYWNKYERVAGGHGRTMRVSEWERRLYPVMCMRSIR